MKQLFVAFCVLILALAIFGCSSAPNTPTAQTAPAANPAPAAQNPPAAQTAPAPAVPAGSSDGVTADDLNTGEVTDPTAGTTGSTTPDVTS